jgi:hypothetical protein
MKKHEKYKKCILFDKIFQEIAENVSGSKIENVFNNFFPQSNQTRYMLSAAVEGLIM